MIAAIFLGVVFIVVGCIVFFELADKSTSGVVIAFMLCYFTLCAFFGLFVYMTATTKFEQPKLEKVEEPLYRLKY